MLGNIDLTLARVTDEATRRRLTAARHAARRGAQLTGQLLAYARKQRLEPRAVDANTVIAGMNEMMQRSLGGLVRVETELAGRGLAGLDRPDAVRAADFNLAINARDAMPAGGTLRIATVNTAAGSRSMPAELAAGDYLRVVVSDTGTGMTPEVLARATEPFFTTKEVGKGSGLGLPQVEGVARQSGGTIRLASTPGIGTTVEVWLPRATPAIAASNRPAPGFGWNATAMPRFWSWTTMRTSARSRWGFWARPGMP